MSHLFRATGASCPADLSETMLIRWCAGADETRTLANNTIRGRTAVVAVFLRWCAKSGLPAPPADLLTDRDSPLRQYRPTYGKAQSEYAPRWLTRDEAFGTLLAAVDSATPLGLRDEIVIRLGLAGVRAQEIVALSVGDIEQLDTPTPSLHWTGKGYKPRRVGLGPGTADALRRYLAAYTENIGHPIPAEAPLICRRRPGRSAVGAQHRLDYGTGLTRGPSGRAAVWNIVQGAAQRAGLGHVAPHDLRRTAAGILHRAKSDDGGHKFDLLDIQKVLGHADPVTTMKCYLDPMDTGVIDRAAVELD